MEWSLIGDDGREYGPIPFERLRAWAREGRVVGSTRVRGGRGPWQRARDVEPLRDDLRDEPLPAGATAASATGSLPLPAAFSTGAFLKTAWRRLDWKDMAVLGLVPFALSAISVIDGVGLGAMLVFIGGGAVWTGLWMFLLDRIDGRPRRIERVFDGFERFLDAFLVHLVLMVGIAAGTFLLIVPGIFLAVLWAFTYPVLADSRLGFLEALSESARLTQGHRWAVLGLGVIGGLMLAGGALFAGIGFYFVLPVVLGAFAVAFRFLQAKQGPPSAAA